MSQRTPSAAFLIYSEYCPKIKGEHPGLSVGDVTKNLGDQERCGTTTDGKQPVEKKAIKLKEKSKDIAAYTAKGKPNAVKKEQGRGFQG